MWTVSRFTSNVAKASVRLGLQIARLTAFRSCLRLFGGEMVLSAFSGLSGTILAKDRRDGPVMSFHEALIDDNSALEFLLSYFWYVLKDEKKEIYSIRND